MISHIIAVGNSLFIACLFILGLGFSGSTAYAQNMANLDDLSARLDSVALLFLDNSPEFDRSLNGPTPSFLYDSTHTHSDLTQTEIDLLKTRREVLNSDYGIELEAGLLQNLDQGVFGAEGIFYQRRAQVGVQWNILKNGLFENKNTLEKLDSEIKLQEKRALAISHQDDLDSRIEQLRADFNSFRVKRLEEYLKVLEEQKFAVTRLYEQNYVTLERVLDVTSNIVKAETAIENNKRIERYLSHSDPSGLTTQDYPVYDIDLERLSSKGLVFYDEITSLQQETEYKFYNELSLSTFLRYNLYGGTNPQNTLQNSGSREFFSAGVSLSLPIPLSTRGKRDIHEQEEKLKRLTLQEEKEDINTRLFDRYRAYQEALQNYVTVYQNVLLQQDRIKVQRVRRTIGSDMYSPSELLDAISELYSVSLQILEVKEELYLRLFEMQSLIPDHSLSAYLIPFDMKGTFYESRPDYGVYLWSGSLQVNPADSLIDQIENEGFQTIYVSAGPEKEGIETIQGLIDSGSGSQEIQLMIGDPNLIFEDGYEKLRNHVALADSIGANGIHLDVEPHTLNDWAENSEEYLQAYSDMVAQVAEWTSNKELMLSISITGDYKSLYDDLESNVDKIVLMTYGSDDFQDYATRFGEVVMEAPLGTAIALRSSDFESFSSMELLMQNIKEGFGVGEFFIHDYESWKLMKK